MEKVREERKQPGCFEDDLQSFHNRTNKEPSFNFEESKRLPKEFWIRKGNKYILQR